MCVIIAKKAGVEPVKKEYLSKAWDSNSHGGGVVFKRPGESVKIKKGFMNKEEFMKYLEDINTKDTAFIAHFRIKSVGDVKPENCHPFTLKNVTFAHNGTLHITPLEGKTDSETFGLFVFKNHTLNWIKENQLLIEMALGTSKFAVMDNKTGEIFILNKDLGKERDNVWFSNESAFPIVNTQSKYPTYCGGGSYYDPSFWNTPGNYKPRAWWGTKKWEEPCCEFNHQDKCWYDKYSHKPKNPMWADNKIVVNKKGFFVLDKDVCPDNKFATHIYSPNDDIIKMVADEQKVINTMVEDYKDSTFDSYQDREDVEIEIQTRYFVLNGIRRLISAQKEINQESLYGYIYANVQKKYATMGQWLQTQFNTFDTSVADLLEMWVEDLGIADEADKLQVA